MCGIAAVFGAPEERAARWVRMMLARIHHRGYSKNELWHGAESGAALGANRLEIVEPARGHQPAQNEDGTIVVVLNGEIYNHGELK